MGNEVPKIPKNRSQSAVAGQGRLRHVEFNKYFDEFGNAKKNDDDEDDEDDKGRDDEDDKGRDDESQAVSPPTPVLPVPQPKKSSLFSSLSKRMSKTSLLKPDLAMEFKADKEGEESIAVMEIETKPEPVVVEAAPVVVEDVAPEPVVEVVPEPVVEIVPEPVVEVVPEPVVETAPEPVVVTVPEPVVVVEEAKSVIVETVPEPVVVEVTPEPVVVVVEETTPAVEAQPVVPDPQLVTLPQQQHEPITSKSFRPSLVPTTNNLHRASLLPSHHRASLLPTFSPSIAATTTSLPLSKEEDSFDQDLLSPIVVAPMETLRKESVLDTPKKKFTFTPLTLPKCFRCGKDVDKLDLCKDGKELVYHKNCLKCSTCGTSLARKERVEFNPNLTSAWHMTHSQFVESDFQLFCNKHNPRQDVVRRSSIKTQDIAQKYVLEEDLVELGHSRKETNQMAKSILEQSGGVTNEILCGRCGSSIETSQAISVSGLEKFHQVCPSKEEIAQSNKSLKYFLKKLPDHLAIQLQWDAELPKRSHTFLFLLDKDTWKRAHLSTGNTCQVEFFPDPDAADPVVHNFQVPNKRGFDAQVKHYPAHFKFSNPRSGGNEIVPTYDEDTGELKISKFSLANGVHQALVVYFIYNEFDPEDPIQSERVILSFEKDVADADPLHALREARKKTATKAEMIDLGESIFASLGEENAVIHEEDEFDPNATTTSRKMPSFTKPQRRTTGVLMQMQAQSQLEAIAAQAEKDKETTAALASAANNPGRRRQTQSPQIQNFGDIRSKFNNTAASVPSAFAKKT
ncbi:hypothetical protein BASA81_004788 [Batrachochytrium salamandrivorans]|nr:hypothetical protein BASA81_004788 [Batrachochytrium salamandrivorans]